MRLPAVLLATALGLVLATRLPLATAVSAGTVLKAEVEDLVERCDLGIEGRVLRLRTLETGQKRIETELTLRVTRAFWGAPSSELVVRIPGGVLPDGRGLLLPGLPTFREGEELLLFLSQENRRGTRMPVGLSQGKFRVERRVDGSRLLVREQDDLEFLDPQSGRTHTADARVQFDYAAIVARLEAAAEARRRALPAGGGR